MKGIKLCFLIFALAVFSHPQADFKSVFYAIYFNLYKYTNLAYKIIFKKFCKKCIKTRAIMTEKSITPTDVGINLFINNKIGLDI
jgi:hypothetical protein